MKSSGKKKIYLGIETTTDTFSVVIGDKKEVIKEKVISAKRHSELLIPGIEGILSETGVSLKDLTAVGIGIGPGSFTGIRIGLSSGITIAQVLDISVYGISSMDIAGKKNMHPVINAFRDKYYYAEYDGSGARETPYMIIDEEKKEKIGCTLVDISARLLLEEIDSMYDSNIKGDWRSIEPIYVMNTEYKPKKRIVS